MSKKTGEVIKDDRIVRTYELSKILKIRDERSVQNEKSKMLMPTDDDETMMNKIKQSVMAENPFVYFYIKDAQMITTEAFIGHKAHYILINSEQMFEALNNPKNMDVVQTAIEEIRGEQKEETFIFVKWYMSIIL